jgi:transposase
MDQRRLFVGDYLTGLWTMTQLCEQFAISRKTGYKWLGRYDTGGRPALADQSRRPHGHPAATSDRVVQRLLETRARFPRWSMAKSSRGSGADIRGRRGRVGRRRMT